MNYEQTRTKRYGLHKLDLQPRKWHGNQGKKRLESSS